MKFFSFRKEICIGACVTSKQITFENNVSKRFNIYSRSGILQHLSQLRDDKTFELHAMQLSIY